MATPDWSSISARAQTILLNSLPADTRIPSSLLPPPTQKSVVDFPAQSGFFTAAELDITSLPATTLVASLAAGELTATEVTKAFIKRASVAQQLTRCLTVTMFDAALLRAKQLDEHFMSTGTTVGPLHGLPVSLKDNFNIRGFPSSVGFTAWALDPWTGEESSLVTTLRELGAVLYVKTNVPTAMMIPESVNNVYGRTVSPLNRELTSGGSSGGESALIAFGGSCLGVGTDIGGSLRIPASCTGIFTLKPSLGRFPHFDARSGLAGQEAIASVQGPMARTLPDLRLWTESIISSSPWLRDPKCLEIPWRPTTLPPKLKLAILYSNAGTNLPTPPVTRALLETAARLSSSGRYEITTWDPSDLHHEAIRLVSRFFLADGGKSVQKILETTAEPIRPEMQPYTTTPELGTYELWQLQKARTALQAAYLKKWVESGIDGIISPVTPYAVAPRNGEFKSIAYTMVWNLLDYSAVSFPCGVRVDKEKDQGMAEEELVGMSEVDQGVQRGYRAEDAHGLEVSLQVVAGRLREEKVLAMTERILEDLKGTA